jgi:uncharacterized damage-inducible protein DinB
MIPTLDHLRHFYRYVTWCDEQHLLACATVPAEGYLKDLGFAFKTIHDTAIHMAGAQDIWLARFLGNTPTSFLSRKECPDLPALQRHWDGLHLRFSAYLEALDEADLKLPFTWTTVANSTENTLPLGHVILHALDHSSYHRGQLNSMIRLAGGKPARNVMYSSWLLATGAHR